MESSSSLPLFEAISASDTEALVHLYGHAAVNALIQYLHHNAGSVPSTGWDRTTDRGMCVFVFWRCALWVAEIHVSNGSDEKVVRALSVLEEFGDGAGVIRLPEN
jgi:hypothetical protein